MVLEEWLISGDQAPIVRNDRPLQWLSIPDEEELFKRANYCPSTPKSPAQSPSQRLVCCDEFYFSTSHQTNKYPSWAEAKLQNFTQKKSLSSNHITGYRVLNGS